jgi:hypothetical protein
MDYANVALALFAVLERVTRWATRASAKVTPKGLFQPSAAEGLQIMLAVRLPLPWQLVCDPGEGDIGLRAA